MPDDNHQCARADRYPVSDARGIFCFFACSDKCEARQKKKYRPEIFEGYDQSDVCEPIEPEDY